MLLPLDNRPRDYAWGSRSALPEFRGLEPDGSPQAELWFGSHPGSPALLRTPEGEVELSSWLHEHPQPRLRADGELPFLLKLLAAAEPLSIQVHPTAEQAAAGHARESASGLPADHPQRSYRDQHHKPELLYALSTRFHALAGFRPVAEARRVLDALLGALAGRAEAAVLGEFLSRLDPSREEESRRGALEWLFGQADAARLTEALEQAVQAHCSRGRPELATIARLARRHPADPGVGMALLLNRVVLRRGQAMFLPAGVPHSYLEGLGVELMAASDNVVRGGLTRKAVDVPELLAIVDLRTTPVPLLKPERHGQGVQRYRPGIPDFVLYHAAVDPLQDAVVRLSGSAIVLAVAGTVQVDGARDRLRLSQGQAAFATEDEGPLSIRGNGEAFVAMAGEEQP